MTMVLAEQARKKQFRRRVSERSNPAELRDAGSHWSHMPFHRISEAALILDGTPNRIYDLLHAGKLSAIVLDRKNTPLVTTELILAFLREGKTARELGFPKRRGQTPISGPGFVYVIEVDPELRPGRIKIGWSTKIEQRVTSYRTINPKIRVVRAWRRKAQSAEHAALAVGGGHGMQVGQREVFDDKNGKILAALDALFPARYRDTRTFETPNKPRSDAKALETRSP